MPEKEQDQFRRNYGKYRLGVHLNFLETERPPIYEIITELGEVRCTVFSKETLHQSIQVGESFREGDLEEEIKKVRESLEKYS